MQTENAKSAPISSRVEDYLKVAKMYYSLAESVQDANCKVAMIYFTALAAQRIEVLSKTAKVNPLSSKSKEKAATASSIPSIYTSKFDIKSNSFVTDGRLTLSTARVDIGIKELNNASQVLFILLLCLSLFLFLSLILATIASTPLLRF